MVVIEGKKYACESCIRGHRVSGCTHTDRDLQFIAPKGRPVKQCDHCRGARKNKSHHAKCDCAGKHDRNETDPEGGACCCMIGDSCACGQKGRTDHRHEGHARSVHSRPHLHKNSSEGHISTFINNQHKAVHRWEKGEGVGSPYPCRKTGNSDGHHHPAHQQLPAHPFKIPQGITKDDSHLHLPPSSIYSSGFGQLSVDNLPLSTFSAGSTFKPFLPASQQLPPTSPMKSELQIKSEFSPKLFKESLLAGPSRESSLGDINPFLPLTSASVGGQPRGQDLFTSENLPLGFPNPAVQAISDGGESLLVPGLTANSSNSPSEMGELNSFGDAALDPTYDIGQLLKTPANMQMFGRNQPTSSPSQMTETLTSSNQSPANFEPQGFDQYSQAISTDEPAHDVSTLADGNLDLFSLMNLKSRVGQTPFSNLDDVNRRSLDINTMRSLSAYPDFDDSIARLLGQPGYSGSETNIPTDAFAAFSSNPNVQPNTQMSPSTNAAAVNVSSNFMDLQQDLATSRGNDNNNATNEGFPNRPRSMPIGPDLSFLQGGDDYDLNANIDSMYPQLDQTFADAASWMPNTLDLGDSSAPGSNPGWLQ